LIRGYCLAQYPTEQLRDIESRSFELLTHLVWVNSSNLCEET